MYVYIYIYSGLVRQFFFKVLKLIFANSFGQSSLVFTFLVSVPHSLVTLKFLNIYTH